MINCFHDMLKLCNFAFYFLFKPNCIQKNKFYALATKTNLSREMKHISITEQQNIIFVIVLTRNVLN